MSHPSSTLRAMTEAMMEELRKALEEGEKTPLVDYSLERVLARIDQTPR